MTVARETPRFEHQSSKELCQELALELIEEASLNEFLQNILPLIGQRYGVDQISLVDYYEQTDHFDLLFFWGYDADATHAIQRRMDEMELRRALGGNEPYHPSQRPDLLCLPMYFSDVLEAVLVLDGEEPIELTPPRREAALVISRLIGLLMSSTRLAVNRQHHLDLSDLQRAREIQSSFLPSSFLTPADSCEVFGFNRSSALVGGDYFDYFPREARSMRCILADACGHGLAAALIMSNFRGLLQSEIVQRPQINGLFDQLNEAVHFDADLIQYLTGVLLQIDGSSRTVHYLNAGHFDPLVISTTGESRALDGGGPPLGMFKDVSYPIGETQLDAGDLIVLFTDGLVDIENSDSEYFGTEGISASVSRHRHRPLEEIATEVFSAADEFSSGKMEDDVTLLLVRVC